MTWWDFYGQQHEGSPPYHDMTNGQDYDSWKDPNELEREPRVPGTWKTKDGRVLIIRDMDNQHLAHTIRLLRRQAERRRPQVELNLASFAASCRGDGATDAAEGEERMVSNMDLDEFCGYIFEEGAWHELIEEAERRNLKVAHDNSKLRLTAKTIIENLNRS